MDEDTSAALTGAMRVSVYLELAKGLISGAIGTDFVIGMRLGIGQGVVPESAVTAAIFLAVVLLSAIGAGVFLLRFFGALMFIARR